jgi:molybdopterin-binding protein
MKISARNQIEGTVIAVKDGAVNGIITLDIGNGNHISATITMDAIKELNLKVGGKAYAIIKASAVMIGIDD